MFYFYLVFLTFPTASLKKKRKKEKRSVVNLDNNRLT